MISRVLSEDELKPPSSIPDGRLVEPPGPRARTEGLYQEGGHVSSEELCSDFGVRVFSGHSASAVLELNREVHEQTLPRRRSLAEQIEESRERASASAWLPRPLTVDI